MNYSWFARHDMRAHAARACALLLRRRQLTTRLLYCGAGSADPGDYVRGRSIQRSGCARAPKPSRL